MSYTYSGNPASSLVDATHFYLGNTLPDLAFATDEECAFALAQQGNNPLLAAAFVAETKAAEFVRRPSQVTREGRTIRYDNQAENFLVLARTLRIQASLRTTGLYAGGLSGSEHGADAGDRDLRQPFARKHLHEYGAHGLGTAPIHPNTSLFPDDEA
jgi:hypothetical protein